MKYELAYMNIVKFCDKNNNRKYHIDQSDIAYELETKYYKRTCLVDHKNKKAYNIYTLEEEFPLLEKNENGFVLPNQDIEFGISYAIKNKSIKMNPSIVIEYLYRKHLLKKVLKRKAERKI